MQNKSFKGFKRKRLVAKGEDLIINKTSEFLVVVGRSSDDMATTSTMGCRLSMT